MTKKLMWVASAALVLGPVIATAQHQPAASVVTATIAGVFSPTSSQGGKDASLFTAGTSRAVLASTPVTPAPIVAGRKSGGANVTTGTINTVNAVVSGSSSAMATFGAALTAGGAPSGVIQSITQALQALSAGNAGGVAAAVTQWNAAMKALSGDQMRGLIANNEFITAVLLIRSAQTAATGR